MSGMYSRLLHSIQSKINLTTAEAILLTSFWKERELEKNEYLLRNGNICNYDCFVLSGSLKAFYIHPETGKEEILFFAIDDWWATDLDSFANKTPSIYNIQALESCTLLQIHRDAFEALLAALPKLERYFRLILQSYTSSIQQRVIFTHAFPAEKRYQNFARQYPQLLQRIPLYLIAAYLGITPEFLSRIRGKKNPFIS